MLPAVQKMSVLSRISHVTALLWKNREASFATLGMPLAFGLIGPDSPSTQKAIQYET